MDTNKGFTLIELLIVIAILGVLAAAVTLVINPIELLAQSRDAERISDMDSLNKSLSLYQVQNPGAMPGSTSTVYVSLTDASSTCGDLGLPSLPSGWTYDCSNNPKKIDSTGWLPVNFSSLTSNSISALPVDPTNSASLGLYYAYTVSGNQYEVTSLLESQKYKSKEETNPPLQDYPGVLAEGTSLSISPLFSPSGLVGYWNFDEGSGSAANDLSGKNDNGTWHGTLGSQWVAGKVGGYAANFDGTSNYVSIDSWPTLPPPGTISMWVNVSQIKSGYLFDSPNNNGLFARINSSTGALLYACHGSTCGVSIQPNPFFTTTNNWVFYTFEFTTSTLAVYQNGQLIQSASGGNGSTTGITSTMSFGYGDVGYLAGAIDDVHVYNRVLSPAEIQAIYNSQR